MFDVDGQVIAVTGACGRLGGVTARLLCEHGAKTVLIDREHDRLRGAYRDLADAREHLLIGGIDLSAPEGGDAFVRQAVERFGRIDALVNTVGAFRGRSVIDDDWETWRFLLDTNVRTTLNACKAVLPTMQRQRRGRIINIASRAALAGVEGLSAYCAAKAAVVRFTESLSAEVKDSGVNVNCILPGTLDTPENRKGMPAADPRTWVGLDSLAAVVLFLASDAASAIHGAAIPVYGTARP